MKCNNSNCKFETLMDYNEENQCYVCPDCGFESYGEIAAKTGKLEERKDEEGS